MIGGKQGAEERFLAAEDLAGMGVHAESVGSASF